MIATVITYMLYYQKCEQITFYLGDIMEILIRNQFKVAIVDLKGKLVTTTSGTVKDKLTKIYPGQASTIYEEEAFSCISDFAVPKRRFQTQSTLQAF